MNTVIVTGAGTGIGAATARRLGGLGWSVALVGRRLAMVEAVAAEIGNDALPISEDLADPAAPARIIAAVLDRFATINALVNNAATIKVMPVEDYPLDEIDRHWQVNIRAPFLL